MPSYFLPSPNDKIKIFLLQILDGKSLILGIDGVIYSICRPKLIISPKCLVQDETGFPAVRNVSHFHCLGNSCSTSAGICV